MAWTSDRFEQALQPIEVIKRNLDGLATVKLNVFTGMTMAGISSRVKNINSTKWVQTACITREQMRDVSPMPPLAAFASSRFDMGHATAGSSGIGLGSAPGPCNRATAGIMQQTLDTTREIYAFLDVFFGEIAALFPDEYIHIGGDENEGKQWDANTQIQEFKRQHNIKDNHSLQAYFTVRVARILEKYGKKVMGWDEIMHPDLPKGVVIHSWRGAKSLADAVKGGYSGVLSAGYYIDLSYPASNHYNADPVAPAANLSAEEESRILGGEATLWGEYVSTETIDSRIWPRTAAIAERLWSPKTVTDVTDMYRRLAVTSVSLENWTDSRTKSSVILRRIAGSGIAPLEKLVSARAGKQYSAASTRQQCSVL